MNREQKLSSFNMSVWKS